MMPLIGESLDFLFYLLNSSLSPHENSFILQTVLVETVSLPCENELDYM